MTIFEKILSGEINVQKVLETEHFIAINDINPQAKIHILIIPKLKAKNLNDIANYNADYSKAILNAPNTLASFLGLSDYRIITNTGVKGGQTVDYLHFHFLSDPKLEKSSLL